MVAKVRIVSGGEGRGKKMCMLLGVGAAARRLDCLDDLVAAAPT